MSVWIWERITSILTTTATSRSEAFIPTCAYEYRLNYNGLCKGAAGLHPNVEVAIVLSSGKLAASHLKSGGPSPDEQEFSKMISQLHSVITTTKANEDKFGELGHITVHYKHVDGLFFPINDRDTLIIGIMPPYDHDGFVSKIYSLVASEKMR